MSDGSSAYGDLSLDDIARLTSADAEHSVVLDGQSTAVRRLSSRVGDALAGVENARRTLTEHTPDPEGRQQVERLFEGSTASAAFLRLTVLRDNGDTGHRNLFPQSDVLADLAGQASAVHADVVELRTERDHWLAVAAADPNDSGLVARFGGGDPTIAINDHYDALARERLSAGAEHYRTTVDQLSPVEPVKPDPPARHRKKTDRVEKVLPAGHWERSGSAGIGPTLQGGGWYAEKSIGGFAVSHEPKAHVEAWHPERGVGAGPVYRPPGPGGPTGNPARPAGPFAGPPESTGGNPPPRNGFVSQRTVVEPVIGARGSGQAPVMPMRRGFGGSGVLPSTIGRRASAGGTMARPPRLGGIGSGSTTGSPAGTRHRVRSTVVSTGRVVTPRQPRPAPPTPPPAEPRFVRQPRLRHGGDDRPNRPVIGNSRAVARTGAVASGEPSATTGRRRPEPEPANQDWLPDTATLPAVIRGGHGTTPSPGYHGDDTGPVITAYSFGEDR